MDGLKMFARAGIFLVGVAATAWIAGACVEAGGGEQEGGVLVGRDGGTFVMSGVVVKIPEGALSSDVVIRVTPETRQIPGFEVDGLVYRFEPSELTFAIPASITFPNADGRAGASVYWARWPNDLGVDDDALFVALPTRLGDQGKATAEVVRFGTGFVGTVAQSEVVDGSIGDGEGPSTDSGLEDADAGDSGDLDGASGASCPVNIPVNPTSEQSVPGEYLSVGTYGCKGDIAHPPIARVFDVSVPSKLTMFNTHRVDGALLSVQLRRGCAGDPLLASHSGSLHRTLFDLTPGRYMFVDCNEGSSAPAGAFDIDPIPVPSNPNTSCGAAIDLPWNTLVQVDNRVYDGVSLYYKISLPPFAAPVLNVGSKDDRSRAGFFRFEVRSVCSDLSSVVQSVQGSLVLGSQEYSLTGVPQVETNTEYWIVVSDMDPGMAPNFRFE